MMDPLISVIVPIYNQEKYVGECLESLLPQASGQVEFILIDDGSQDGSAAVCQAYLNRFPAASARLIRQSNHGLLKTREIGLGLAEGEYVLFVDSDDCLMANALETLLEAIQAKRPDMLLFNASNRKTGSPPLFSYPFPDGAVFEGEEKYALYRLLCATDQLNNIWAKCIKRSLFSDEAVFRDIEGVSNGEDLYQSLALMDRVARVLFLDRVLYFYRVTGTGMSRTYNPRHFSSEKKVCARRLEYAKKWSRNGDELVDGAKKWICRILRDVTRKLFVSDLPWPAMKKELQLLRGDDFYRQYYLNAHCSPDKRDIVLKSQAPLLGLWRLLYRLIPRDGRRKTEEKKRA